MLPNKSGSVVVYSLLFVGLVFCSCFVAYSKTCVKRSLSKRHKIGFQDQLSLNAGQKYCRMLQPSAIVSNFIKLPFFIKIFVLSIFEWPFYTGFTVVLIVPSSFAIIFLSKRETIFVLN